MWISKNRILSLWSSFCLLKIVGGKRESFLDHEQLMSSLQELSDQHPSLATVYVLGQSEEGREIKALRLSPTPTRPCLTPMAKYVANMHGNEVHGRELLLRLATELLESYTRGNEEVQALLNGTEIHLVPTINPDGFARASSDNSYSCFGVRGRNNANGVDLNRNFPSWKDQEAASTRSSLLSKRQAETRLMVEWTLDNPFVLSANLHDGEKVANYPWDDHENRLSQYSRAPDDEMFILLAKTYADNHGDMWNNPSFAGGITNGAEWYTIRGGMQDFNYIFSDCMELTIEVENCKYPESNTIEHDWTLNKDSLIKYLKAAHYGIKGYVTDSMGKKIAGARIVVKDNDRYVYSSNCGEYWRLLVPGIYEVRAFGPGGLFSDWKLVKIPSLSHEALRLDLVMDMVDLSQADSQVDYIPSLRNTLDTSQCQCSGSGNPNPLGTATTITTTTTTTITTKTTTTITTTTTTTTTTTLTTPTTTKASTVTTTTTVSSTTAKTTTPVVTASTQPYPCPPANGAVSVTYDVPRLERGQVLILQATANGSYTCQWNLKAAPRKKVKATLLRDEFDLEDSKKCKIESLLFRSAIRVPDGASKKLCGRLSAESAVFESKNRKMKLKFKSASGSSGGGTDVSSGFGGFRVTIEVD